MYYVYILLLKSGKHYIGFSSNLKQRVHEHSLGKVSATKNQLPVKLVYDCAFVDKKKALDFENYLKTNSGFAFRNKHLI
jgi:putative endonuclease